MAENNDAKNDSKAMETEQSVDKAADQASSELDGSKEGEKPTNDDVKAGDEEEDEDHNDDEENVNVNESAADAAEKFTLRNSLFIKIIGFKRLANIEDELKAYHKFFTKCVEVEAPLIQIPGAEDKWVYFEMKSLEDKIKVFRYIRKSTWEGQKLAAKAVAIKPNAEVKPLKKMTVEEGLKILYPLQDSLYAQQIKTKHATAKELMENLIPKTTVMKYTKGKKYLKTIRLREMLPMHPIEGYETSTLVCVEQNPSTGEFEYGIRVLSEDKESSVLIPLDQCISIPHQIAVVAKRIITALPEVDITPYNFETKEGDLVSFGLRMTAYGSFMVTIMVPKVVALAFRQLTAEGVDLPEGEKPEESYSALIKKRIDELTVKLEKFINNQGKLLSVDSIYLVMVHPNYLMTSMEDTNSGSFHIIGQKHLPDKLNGINLRMSWERDRHVEVFRPLLSLIEAQGCINSTTRLYLATPYRLLGLYFAKRCAHVTLLFFWSKENINELQTWAKQLGYHNIDFVNAKAHFKKKFANENAVTIFWQFTKPNLLEKFVSSDVRTILFITYWNKKPQENFINLHKRQLEAAYSKLKISYLCPFDLAPYKEGYGMAVIFNGFLNEALDLQARKMRGMLGPKDPKLMRGGRPGPYMRGPPHYRGQVSAFERLGPREPHRGYDEDWGRPDPWMGQAPPQPAVDTTLKQLDQVASGVMQNLQAVSQQMQAFIPSLLQGSHPNAKGAQEGSGWSSKRRYAEDYSDDDDRNPDRWANQRAGNDRQYSSYDNRDYKRRREEPIERRADDTGRWGGGNESYGDRSGAIQQPDNVNTYGEQQASWGNTTREPGYYEKGRTTTAATGGWSNAAPTSNWEEPGTAWNNTSSSWNNRKYY